LKSYNKCNQKWVSNCNLSYNFIGAASGLQLARHMLVSSFAPLLVSDFEAIKIQTVGGLEL
jgi:hypothetical protein